MKEYATGNIRNVVLIGHGSTGKTSLSEAMLFTAKAINRLGRVDDGTTTSDFDPDEQRRAFSVNLSLLPCEWNGHKLNMLDTPGYADFVMMEGLSYSVEIVEDGDTESRVVSDLQTGLCTPEDSTEAHLQGYRLLFRQTR